MDDSPAHEAHAPVPYRVFVNVWVALILLTGVTVTAGVLDLKHLALFVALLVAVVKSTLVVLYFMHLRYEKLLFTWMFVAVVAAYVTFLLLTFSDYSFRT